MKSTPGLTFISRIAPGWIATGASMYMLLEVIQRYGILDVPTWVVIVISIVTRPAILPLQGYWEDFYEARRAAAVGASVIPTVHEKWPDSITTVKKLLDGMKEAYPGDLHVNWIEKYGHTFQLLLPFEKRVVTFDPDHVKAILATQFDKFVKGMFAEQCRSLLGTGVFNSDGDMWKFHRAMTKPFVIRERISDFKIFGEKADQALQLAKLRLDEGYAIDFQDLAARFTLDSASEFLFGHDAKSLEAGLAYPESAKRQNPSTFDTHPSNQFAWAFAKGQDMVSLRARRGQTWPLHELFKDTITPQREIVNEYIRPLLQKTIKKKKEREEEGDGISKEPENLLDHLVQHTEDSTVLLDELVNLMVAGRDGVASLLTFSVYMMSEYPAFTERLRDEIFSKVGHTKLPSYDDIREMKYLRAFLNEVLRLYPPVPLNSRDSKEETILTSRYQGVPDFYVPASARCVFSIFVMHRRTDLWGPDALEFDPDRFLDERHTKYLLQNPFMFCPFNAGPRICVGQQLAYQEASFFIVRLLQRFSSISFAPDAQPVSSLPPKSWAGAPGRKGVEKVRPHIYLTMHIKGGFWVRMTEAGASE